MMRWSMDRQQFIFASAREVFCENTSQFKLKYIVHNVHLSKEFPS